MVNKKQDISSENKLPKDTMPTEVSPSPTQKETPVASTPVSPIELNDLRIGYAFMLEDNNGIQIQLADKMTFKAGLEPGMIVSISKRVDNVLNAMGQDYFMYLVRDYISKKQEEIYKQEVCSPKPEANSKYIARGVVEIIGDPNTPAQETTPSDEMEIER